MSRLKTDMGNANTAIPVLMAASDVRFSAKINWASLMMIGSGHSGSFGCTTSSRSSKSTLTGTENI